LAYNYTHLCFKHLGWSHPRLESPNRLKQSIPRANAQGPHIIRRFWCYSKFSVFSKNICLFAFSTFFAPDLLVFYRVFSEFIIFSQIFRVSE